MARIVAADEARGGADAAVTSVTIMAVVHYHCITWDDNARGGPFRDPT